MRFERRFAFGWPHRIAEPDGHLAHFDPSSRFSIFHFSFFIFHFSVSC
jgi:hypothetical protein